MMSKARLWLGIGAGVIAIVVLYNLFGSSPPAGEALSYTTLLKEIESDRVVDVVIDGEELVGHRLGGEQFYSIIPDDPQFLIEALMRSGATITLAPHNAVFVGVLVYYLRRIAESLRASVDKLDAVTGHLAQHIAAPSRAPR